MSVLEKVSVASGRSSPRVPFGWPGIIELTPQPTGLGIEHLSSYFQPVSGTATAVTWHGEGMAAFSLQHQADSLLAPGSSSLRIPSVGPCQGMVHGWFFSPSAATPPVPPSESLPEAISHKITFDYVEHGFAAFTRLNGTWAGVIWDKAKQRAVFARDGAGFETLYVVRREPQIIFASDLRILRLAGWAGEYDEQAIAEFLYFLHVPSPRSVYKDVRCVLPGHALIVEPQGIRQERFAPRRFVQGVKLGDDEKVQSAIQESLPPFEERLLTAVASCIPQRGRIGLLMSAGKDSPALAIALRVLEHLPHTLTLGARPVVLEMLPRLLPGDAHKARIHVEALGRIGALHRILQAVRVVEESGARRTLAAKAAVAVRITRKSLQELEDAVLHSSLDAASRAAYAARRNHCLHVGNGGAGGGEVAFKGLQRRGGSQTGAGSTAETEQIASG